MNNATDEGAIDRKAKPVQSILFSPRTLRWREGKCERRCVIWTNPTFINQMRTNLKCSQKDLPPTHRRKKNKVEMQIYHQRKKSHKMPWLQRFFDCVFPPRAQMEFGKSPRSPPLCRHHRRSCCHHPNLLPRMPDSLRMQTCSHIFNMDP